MQIKRSAAYGRFELYDAIAGRAEQTLTIKVFGIGEHLRDASMMHDDRGCVGARCDGCCPCEWARVRLDRRKKIEPIADRARHNGSQSWSQAQ